MPDFISLPPDLRLLLINNGINFLAALLSLAVGWTVAKFAGRWAHKGLDRIHGFDSALKPLLASIVRYAILAVTLIAVLQRFGVATTSLIAVLGAAGLAIGLALQGTLSNVAAGVMLLILRPFNIGDYINIGAVDGTVREIGLFTTILVSPDLLYISVPNSAIFGGTIINYSREPTRRINFSVGIDYADDVGKAQALVLEILEKDPRILDTPAPMVPVGALGASSVDLTVRCWVPNKMYWDVLFDIQKAIKLRFDEEGITIPFPQQVITVKDNHPALQGK